MPNIKDLKRGSSCCLFGNPNPDTLKLYSEAGIKALELHGASPEAYSENETLTNRLYKDFGIELWSMHLPFSGKLDISKTDDTARRFIIDLNKSIIEECGKLGVKVAVLHPSSEPIADEERPERLRRSREAIIELREFAKEHGMLLAVENLPRTCLCNRSSEMIELVSGTGAGIVFDTNHSLLEDNCDFLNALINAGLPIYSLHISDYDTVDERHVLPGEGVNKWKNIFEILMNSGYSGPLLYEVPAKPRSKNVPYTANEIRINQDKLISGEIK